MTNTKPPVNIMEFGMVTKDVDVIPAFNFLHGLRLNVEAYIKCLDRVLLLWTEKQNNAVLAVRDFLWPHDP